LFKEHGWKVMYYFLPTRNDVSGGVECPPQVMKLVANESAEEQVYNPSVDEMPQIKQYAKNVAALINRQESNSVSFWAEGWPFIQQEILPYIRKDVGLATWAIPSWPGVTEKDFQDKFQQNKYVNILMDDRVHTILYGIMSFFSVRT
ncbi:MAG: hypothetical protein IJ709_12930, partial [Selenomonas sp.]|nr:hypothetical protein [Selenomonas sp.]